MCIPIRKVAEDDSTVTYRFESAFWTRDPEQPTRRKVYAVYHGEILADKLTKDCLVIKEMPFDKGRVSSRALHVIRRHIERAEYPDETMFASG